MAFTQAEILEEFAVNPYNKWDLMCSKAYELQKFFKRRQWHRWIEKPGNRERRIAYMKAYNRLPSTRIKQNRSRSLKGRVLWTAELAKPYIEGFKTYQGSKASYARLHNIKYQTMVDILKGKHGKSLHSTQ
jgi:hypothetical protein